MATNKTTRTTKKVSKTQSTEDQVRTPRARKVTQDKKQDLQVEHNHGEPTEKHIVDEGDLDEETLNRNAPYNRTYGRTDE